MIAVSAESGIDAFTKLGPYEAQYMARAHESHSFLVQANVGATQSRDGSGGTRLDAQGGSHGNSLVIAPDGNLMIKAPVFGEHIVLQDLDLRKASAGPGYRPHAFMQPMYDAGAALLSRKSCGILAQPVF